ncbi:MAG: translocation/assembly module TamB domain-containing protein [Kordiimonadaceae bacterium]|nr:translocation/assembly module TamB domain-containing protein [Kordiimonadaceae bacterium]
MADINSYLNKFSLRKLAKYLGGLLGLLFLGIIVILFYLSTQAGRDQITRYINNALKSDDGAIIISKLEGALYSEIRIPNISFIDRDGSWLEIENTKIYWSLGDLFNGRLSVAQLSADQVNFMRNPVGNNEQETGEKDQFTIPELPIDIYIDRFEIGRINVSENITKKISTLTANGLLMLTENNGLLTKFNLLTVSGSDSDLSGDQILVDISYPKTGEALNVDIGLNAPEDGLFVALAGIEPRQSISAHFNGTGPIDNWSGKLEARASSKVFAMAGVNYRNGEFSLQSNFDPSGFVSGEVASLIGNANSLELVIAPTDQADMSALKLMYQAKILTLNANGIISAEKPENADGIIFDAELKDTEPLNSLINPAYIEPFKLKGRLDNPLQSLKITLDIDGANLGQLENGEVSISALLSGHFETLFDNGKIINSSSGKLTSLKMKNEGKAQALFNKDLNWSTGIEYDLTTSTISIDRLSLENEFAKLTSNGTFNTTDGQLTGTISTVVDNIAGLAEKLEITPAIAGMAEFSAQISRTGMESPLSADLDLKTTGLDLGNDLINEIIGDHPTFRAKIRQNADGAITLSDTVLNGTYTSLNAAGELSADQEFEHSDFTLSISDMDKIDSLEGAALAGNIDINGTLEGDVSAPKVTLETVFDSLDIQGIELENFKAQLKADDIINAPRAELILKSGTSLGALSLSSEFLSEQNGYKIEGIQISLGAFEATGSIDLPTGKPVKGSISITTDENKSHQAGVEGVVTAKIDLSDQENIQDIVFDGTLENLTLPLTGRGLLSIQSAKINADARLFEQKPIFKVSAAIEKLMHPLVQADQASISASQDDKDLSFSLSAAGSAVMPYHVTATGKSTDDLNDILVTLEGDIDQTDFNLAEPAHILMGEKSFELLPFNLKMGEGDISGHFNKGGTDFEVNLTLNKIAIRPFSVLLQDRPMVGQLDGQIGIDGKDNILSGNYSLSISNLGLESYRSLGEQRIELTAAGTINNDTLSLNGVLKEDGANKADYSATLPLNVDFSASKIEVVTENPFSATLNWNNDIGSIWPMFNLASDDLRGELTAKLNFGGTLSNPDLDGSLNLLNGHYENLKAGFVADNITMIAGIKDREIKLESFTATDGEEGKISASGLVNLDEDFNYTAEATLNLVNAHLVRQPELQIIASSDLSFVKNETSANLSGKIIVDNASIGAIEQSAPEIVQLDVTEINSEGLEINNNNEPVKPINLDLTLDVPGKLFIRSYGLDSEWKADLAVKGTSEEPMVNGTASLIRGFFEFSGKRFILTRGNLTFPEDGSNDPIADVEAEHQLSDLLAKLNITGRVSKPTIKMSSNPYLPENELMARILFGTSVSELSAVELVQLASAVHSMSNGGGQGFMGGIRNAIGIDRLSIDNDASREYGTTITGGKYLTNNVYVEVSTAPATGETSTAVEVDLTKNLSLVTKRTLDHDNSLSIRWSWDY